MYENAIQDNRMRPEIYEILEAVRLAAYYAEILRISAVVVDDGDSALRDLMLIDKTIPGLGQHNVSKGSTGVYRIPDRPIFRPIQYVDGYLKRSRLEWLTRSIVTMSCLHVENSLKRRLNIDGRLSIGMILKRGKAESLDPDLLEVLLELNEAVYNNAKHSIERTYAEGHMFSIPDSLAVYLICRTLGARLLKNSGITTRSGEPVFD